MTSQQQSTPPISLAGVWKRLWEQDPIGDEDTADKDTLVLWTQAPKSGIYVDIRLPKEAPGRSKELAEAHGFAPTPEALQGTGLSTSTSKEGSSELMAMFTQQKSFAGVMEFAPGDSTTGDALKKDKELAKLAAAAEEDTSGALPLCTCFWRRHIDYQPPTGDLDIGVCASGPPNADGSTDLRETGADGSYAELWRRSSDKGPFLALQLLSENGSERVGYWVRTGQHFAYAVGRPGSEEAAAVLGCRRDSVKFASECTGKSLKDAVESLHAEQSVQMQLLGSYVAVAGEIEKGEGGACSWIIQHSTDPGLVGCHLIGSSPGDLNCSTITASDSSGNPKSGDEIVEDDIVYQTVTGDEGRVRKWKVMEISGPNMGLTVWVV